MSKQTSIATTVFLIAIISLIAGTVNVKVAEANFNPTSHPPPSVTVTSPQIAKTYANNTEVNFTVTHVSGWFYGKVELGWFGYKLDNGTLLSFDPTPTLISHEELNNSIDTEYGVFPADKTQWSAKIVGLSSGSHTIEVWVQTKPLIYSMDFGSIYGKSDSIDFIVDENTSQAPAPTLSLSPLPSPSLTVTPTPTISPAPSVSLTQLPSPTPTEPFTSPTQQPTLSPSPANPTYEVELFVDPQDHTRLYMFSGSIIVIAIIMASILLYFKKFKKQKQD